MKNSPFKAFNQKDLAFRLPFAMIVAGPQSSGKTTFVVRLVENLEEMFSPVPKSVMYCYSEYNSAIPMLQKLGVQVYAGVPGEEILSKQKKPLLLIMDDLMLHVEKKYLDLLVTVKSHHQNIGVIFMAQNLFDKNLKTARDNSQYIVVMNSPSSLRQIRDIGTSLFPGKTRDFMEIYNEATKHNYGYLLINLHAGVDNDLRLSTNIFPDELRRVFRP